MARILICDDSDYMRNYLRGMLEKAGHSIVGTAEDGNEAVERYKVLKPDLVTMDILMKHSGVDAIREIFKNDPAAKIIVISMLDDHQGDVVQAIRLGAAGYANKPIHQETLCDEVNRVLGGE